MINARIMQVDNGFVVIRRVFDWEADEEVSETTVHEYGEDGDPGESVADVVHTIFEDYTQTKRQGGVVVEVKPEGYDPY